MQARILEAAILRFGQYSYKETKLRDITTDVRVDGRYSSTSGSLFPYQ